MGQLVGFVFLPRNPPQMARIAAKSVATEVSSLHVNERRRAVCFFADIAMGICHPSVHSEVAISIRLLGKRPSNAPIIGAAETVLKPLLRLAIGGLEGSTGHRIAVLSQTIVVGTAQTLGLYLLAAIWNRA